LRDLHGQAVCDPAESIDRLVVLRLRDEGGELERGAQHERARCRGAPVEVQRTAGLAPRSEASSIDATTLTREHLTRTVVCH
jgi:hypothetical protein